MRLLLLAATDEGALKIAAILGGRGCSQEVVGRLEIELSAAVFPYQGGVLGHCQRAEQRRTVRVAVGIAGDGRPGEMHLHPLAAAIASAARTSDRLHPATVAAIEKFRNNLRDRNYAHRTINTILRIMGAVFKLWIKRGQCAKNPVDSVERAVQVAKKLESGKDSVSNGNDTLDLDNVLSPTEIQVLLQAAQPGFQRVLFETAYLTGAREGELLALRWTDLELPKERAGKMAIRRSLSWARLKGEKTRPRYFPPKTEAGRRMISIPALLVADLKRWKLQCPKSEEGLVFPTLEGKPVCRDWLLRVAFYPTLSRARLRRVTFHTLRHSCASAMIAAGAPVTEVQHRLGHANPAITLQVYAHFFKHTESGAADQIANVVLCGVGSAGELEKSGHQVGTQGSQAVEVIAVSA